MILGIIGAATVFALAPPSSASPCPAHVGDAVLQAHAGAVVNECKQETEDGKMQYEVKITLKDGKRMELDVDPAGKILQTEEYLELAAVPAVVMRAFTTKFPGAKATKAEKQTASDGKVTYEIRYGAATAKKEVTFTADGALVEEEGQD
jgi:uncharacterized protein YxeA